VGPASSLNDATETQYFPQILKETISAIRKRLADLGQLDSLKETKLDLLERNLIVSASAIYILSLTEMHDQLSQWRAYANNGMGYSFGVPTSAIVEAARDQDFFIVKCCYDEELARDFATGLLEAFLNKLPDKWSGPKDSGISLMKQFVQQISPIFKHPSFSEEKEWRVFRNLYSSDSRIQHRATQIGIINFTTLRWVDFVRKAQEDNGNRILVIAGPGIRNSEGVETIFSNKGLNVFVQKSAVPYLPG
jgi:hypothetical protein